MRSRPRPKLLVATLPVALVSSLALSLALPGCGGGGGGASPSPEPMLMPDWGKASVLGGGGVLTYAFQVEPADLARLEATALLEEYVPAQLTVSGQTVGTVGLRFKGSDGTLTPCFEDGRQVCAKASFKVRFDEAEVGRRWMGLERLNFHSMIDDPSQLHERLNARLFSDMEIVAPRVAHAFLSVNGERKGLFAVVEDIDDHFAQDRFRDDGQGGGRGNVYKDAWPVSLEPDDYTAALQTNRMEADPSRMLAFAQALRAGTPEQVVGALDRFASVDYLLRFLAVDRAIGNYDGITAFYCDGNGGNCSNHNFFWYEAPGAQPGQARFWLVPWDLGDSLALHTPFDAVPAWDRPPADCSARVNVEGGLVMPPGCDPVFQALRAAGRPAWERALDRLLEVWDVSVLRGRIQGWAAEIAPAVALDPNGPGPVAWRAAVRALERDVAALRERLEALRAETNVEAFALPAPGATSFETLSALSVLLGTSSEANPRSGVVHRLNQETPISGGADLRLDFELANETGAGRDVAFQQWAVWRIPLGAPGDLSKLSRIQLRLLADNIRHVRIEIDSPRYPDSDSPRYGWDVLAVRQYTDLTLPRGELALSSGAQSGPVPLTEILAEASALVISPEPRGRTDDGVFPGNRTDPGFLQLDDVRIDTE